MSTEFMIQCISEETDIEGGYVNDPIDLGNETNHGVTLNTANKYRNVLITKFKWSGKMTDLSIPMATFIYSEEFWHPMRLDQISSYSKTLAKSMFRWGLKSGSKRPVSSLQETLNCSNNRQEYYPDIKVDGLMGPKTLATIKSLIDRRGNSNALTLLVAQMNADQLHWMKSITLSRPDELNERFYWGWAWRCIREISEYTREYGLPKS